MKRYSINEFIENYSSNSDAYYGFYDWFCAEDSLSKKAKGFVPKLKFLVNQGLIDGDKMYVWFKNNCPMQGSLYDDMRFSTLDEEEDFLGGLTPRSGHDVDNKCDIWGFDDTGLVERSFKDWNTFKREVKENEYMREFLRNLWKV